VLSASAWFGPATGLRGQNQEPAPAPAALFQLAAELETAEQWAEAADVYAQILEWLPDSQRAAVSMGVCWFKDGQIEQAIAALTDGVAMNPHAYWAEVGLYYVAAAHQQAGSDDAATAPIALLEERFPESAWTARAQILEVQGNVLQAAAAEAAFSLELAAAVQLQSALQAAGAADAAPALAALDVVIGVHPDSGAALRAREAKGQLLIRDHQLGAGQAEFQAILEQLGQTRPNARIVVNAKLQLAAAYFESLQLPGPEIAQVTSENREQLRAMCSEVANHEGASGLMRATARLMGAESWAWQRKPGPALAAANQFLAMHDAAEFKREVATARLFAGESLQIMGYHQAALAHYQWIVEAYPGDAEIWPGLANLARTHYRVFDALRRSGASAPTVNQAGQYVLEHFPGTRYAELVANALGMSEDDSPGTP